MSAPGVEAFFLPTARGRLLLLHHLPAGGSPRAAMIYVHPFAEEMNKSRRMAACQARRLAAVGIAVLQVDLSGCGDSEAEFHAATWEGWIDDVTLAMQWLRSRHPVPLWLWGLRAGALVACASAHKADPADVSLLLWQPMTSGKTQLQQFLRLKLAEGLQRDGAQPTMADLRSTLQTRGAIEVAGYMLSSALAEGLERATLVQPALGTRVVWIEVSARPDAGLLPASQSVADRWAAAGVDLATRVAAGPGFWQTTEIEEAPDLIEQTLQAVLAQAEQPA